MNEIYSAGLMSESFWFIEFKQAVKLRADGLSIDEVRDRCLADNLFGYTKERRARAVVNYILSRIRSMDDKLIEIFMSSDLSTQKLINLVTVLRKDRLFFEFVYEVYREKVLMGIPLIELSDAKVFMTRKEQQYEDIAVWTDTTKSKLRANYLRFMTDANLITAVGKEKSITPPLMDVMLERYLKANGEESIFKAITGGR